MRLSRFISLIAGVMMMGLGVALVIQPSVSEAAFGTSPPWVKNDHLLPGTTFEQIINLSRNDDSMDMRVNVRMDGDKEILKWLQIENQKNLLMKKGQKVLPMKVVVKVPRNAALKQYKGGIFVTLESIESDSKAQGGNVSIKLGAHILVDLVVIGDKVTDYRVKSITLDPLYEDDIFHLNIEIENMGNTEITELNGQVDIYDKKETSIIKTVNFGKLADAVSPDTTVRTRVNFTDLKLDVGEYWVVAKIFRDGKVIYENRLYQKVDVGAVPAVAPEGVEVKRPGIPSVPTQEPADDTVQEPIRMQSDDSHLYPAAPVIQQTDGIIIIFGVVGLGFGLLSLSAIIILLIILIRNQKQAAIQRYLSDHKFNNE